MREVHLAYDANLSRPNTFRTGPACSAAYSIIEARVRVHEKETESRFLCKCYGRDVPHDRRVPNLARVGEHEWRVEPCLWPDSSGIPHGVAVILTGWEGIAGG